VDLLAKATVPVGDAGSAGHVVGSGLAHPGCHFSVRWGGPSRCNSSGKKCPANRVIAQRHGLNLAL